MDFRGWMYDVAREQSPTDAGLDDMLRRSRDAGFNALGLYLEHRFAYASAPWAAAPGCLTPDRVRRLTGLRVIPFLNTLGHMEGFIRSEGGAHLVESRAHGSLQICPTRCADFARGLVADTMEAFADEWVHLGGDETRQLGECPQCRGRSKPELYGAYFGALCRWVLERKRRPCLWGDMLIAHPEAMDAIPRETVIFDWQYWTRPEPTTRLFREKGFDVVCCPSIQTYSAGWCHVGVSQVNIDQHAEDARAAGALGVLVTTWELSHFTNYESVLPLVYAAGRRLSRGEAWPAAIAAEGGEAYARGAEILGNRVPAASRFLAPDTWRQMRDRLVYRLNPFELWRDWREEACGPVGDRILAMCGEARGDPRLEFALDLHAAAVEWVRMIEQAARLYARRDLEACASQVVNASHLLKRLQPGLEAAADAGGSRADIERLHRLNATVVRVWQTLRQMDLKAGQRPSFETLVHDAFVPGDQAAWPTGR